MVRLNKGIRNDQLAESEWFLNKSDAYNKSVFKSIGQVSKLWSAGVGWLEFGA